MHLFVIGRFFSSPNRSAKTAASNYLATPRQLARSWFLECCLM